MMEKSVEIDPRLLQDMHLGNEVAKVLPAMHKFLDHLSSRLTIKERNGVKTGKVSADFALSCVYERAAIEMMRDELEKLVKQGNSASKTLEPHM